METIYLTQSSIIEKVADFMEKAPGVVSLIVTLVVLVGFIG